MSVLSTRISTSFGLGLLLWGVLALPGIRRFLESTMLSHVLIELPGLVLVGYLIGLSARPWFNRNLCSWNQGGLTGLVFVVTIGLFWMLPRWLDASLDYNSVEVAKYLSLPLMIGVPLALSWPNIHVILRGFLKANFLSMLVVLGWLYSVAPVRLCNNYLNSDQENLGLGLFCVAAALAVIWVTPFFFDRNKPSLLRNIVFSGRACPRT